MPFVKDSKSTQTLFIRISHLRAASSPRNSVVKCTGNFEQCSFPS